MIEVRAIRQCDRCSAEMGEIEIVSHGSHVPPVGEPVFEMRVAKKVVEFHDLCDSCVERLKALQEQASPVSRPSRRRARPELGATSAEPKPLED